MSSPFRGALLGSLSGLSVFRGGPFTASLRQTGPVVFAFTSTSIVSQPENSPLTYYLSTNRSGVTYAKTGGADSAAFTLDGNTGALTLAARDFEAPTDAGADNSLQVQITATHAETGDTAVQLITVSITDINENAPASKLLMEDGVSRLLMQDGVSFLLLEA